MSSPSYTQSSDFREACRHSIAASLACLVEQVLHPLEVIKTRLQSHDGSNMNNLVPKYKSLVNASSQILMTEGFRGLYRGVLISLISNNIAKTIYFGVYGNEKSKYERFYGPKSQYPTLFASAESALVVTVLTSPLWVTKTRVLLNTHNESYRSLKSVVIEIYHQHGIAGFYRGMVLSLFLCAQGVVQLCIYENLKSLMNYTGKKNLIQASIPAYSGVISKFLASLMLYPLTLVRTRIQQNQYVDLPGEKYLGSYDCIKKTFKNEGVSGFYKGFLPGTLRALPANAVFFFFYEFFRRLLPF